MTDFAQAFIAMLRADPHVRSAFGDPPPIYSIAPESEGFPLVFVDVRSAGDCAFDLRITVKTSGEQKADILARLDALATAIRSGDLAAEGYDITARRIRLMDIFLDDSFKSRDGLIRARIQLNKKEKQYDDTFS